MDLNTCRAIGVKPGAIPWTAIQEWADRYGLSDADRYLLEQVIPHLDRKILKP